jgi:hypothetical protein
MKIRKSIKTSQVQIRCKNMKSFWYKYDGQYCTATFYDNLSEAEIDGRVLNPPLLSRQNIITKYLIDAEEKWTTNKPTESLNE